MVKAVLADWRTAPISAHMRGTLEFLEKVTLTPDEVGPRDVQAARRAGATDAALREAIYVGCLFSIVCRLVDTFDCKLVAARGLKWGIRIQRWSGYRSSSVLG